MAGFDHTPSSSEKEPEGNAATARYGYAFFVVYLVVYGGYVLTNAFAPSLMAKVAWEGVNLAILSGLLLIAVAFILAILYEWLCRRTAGSQSSSSAAGKGAGE